MEKGERDRWQPTSAEVSKIILELRPVIAEIAHRDQLLLARELVAGIA